MLSYSSVLMCVTASLWAERQYRICAGLLIKYKIACCEDMAHAHLLYGLCHIPVTLRHIYDIYLLCTFKVRLWAHTVLFKIYKDHLCIISPYVLCRTAAHKLNWQHVLLDFCIVLLIFFKHSSLFQGQVLMETEAECLSWLLWPESTIHNTKSLLKHSGC